MTYVAETTNTVQFDTTQRTHGPAYLTTDALDACLAWEMDDTQWVLSDGTAYLVGYAPAMFRMGPMAHGWRISCPEELMARALGD